jgi:hypothetical protein
MRLMTNLVRTALFLGLLVLLFDFVALAGSFQSLSGELSKVRNDYYLYLKAHPNITPTEANNKLHAMMMPIMNKGGLELVTKAKQIIKEESAKQAAGIPKFKNAIAMSGKGKGGKEKTGPKSDELSPQKRGTVERQDSGPSKPEVVLDGSAIPKEIQFNKQKKESAQ